MLFDLTDISFQGKNLRPSEYEMNKELSFFDKISCASLICKNDPFSTVLVANKAFYDLIGYSAEEFQLQLDNQFSQLVVDNLDDILIKVSEATRNRKVLDYEYRIKHKNGDIIWIHDIATYHADEDVFYVVIMDISYRERQLKRATKTSEIDFLSHVLNRRGLERKIKVAMHDARSSSQGLILLDLDNFKQVNDRFGHQAGDEIITGVGMVLKDLFAERGIAGRLGGDEFMVYVNGLSCQAELAEIISTISSRIHFTFDDIHVGSSIGAIYEERATLGFEALYARADTALYQVKNDQKGQFAIETAPIVERRKDSAITDNTDNTDIK